MKKKSSDIVAEIKLLSISPGDIILVKVKKHKKESEFSFTEKLNDILEELQGDENFWSRLKDNLMIGVEEGVDISALPEKLMEASGWVRKQ